MSGGIEDQIFENIATGSGEDFAEGDTYDPSTEPATRQRSERETDPELDNAQDQLSRRARPRDENLPPDQRQQLPKGKKPDQRQDGDDRTDEFGNRIGSNSYHVTRRLKSQLDNQRQVTSTLKSQLEDLTRRLAEREVVDGIPKQLGLNDSDMKDFAVLASVFKGNPVEGARKAIEVALARGANLKDIVNDEFIPNINLNAVRALIDQRLPEPKPQPQVDKDDGLAEGHQFLADYPDASIHSDVMVDQIAKIRADYEARGIKASNYLIAEKAFQRLEEFCRVNQFDITQPLAPQVQARQRQAPSGDRNNTPRRQSPRPMPNGRGGDDLQPRSNRQATPDDSYSSIVRESMREAGII